jgi:hypothetical protein
MENLHFLEFDNTDQAYNSQIERGENWQIAAKNACFAYHAQHTTATVEVVENYNDPISGLTSTINALKPQPSSDVLSYRLIDPHYDGGVYHPTDTNKIMYPFNPSESAQHQVGYYTTQQWRDDNIGGDGNLLTYAEAVAAGYQFGLNS